jgi:hypothetical protein
MILPLVRISYINVRNMVQELTKEAVVAVMLTTFQEIRESFDGEQEILSSSKPGLDFVYIDSPMLLQVTGVLAEALGIDIPKKCQIFLGADGEQLTIDQAAEKLLSLAPADGPR